LSAQLSSRLTGKFKTDLLNFWILNWAGDGTVFWDFSGVSGLIYRGLKIQEN
jgi:hypothetical protein